MMEKKILWIDMDGVIVDFEKNVNEILNSDKFIRDMYGKSPDRIPGVFRNPPPIEGAIDAVHKLYEIGKYDMFIATAAPWGNPESAVDKRYWIEQYFGRMFRKKMVITHLKHLLIGDYLIDDRTANGAGDFGKITGRGEHIHFGHGNFTDWNDVLNYLI
jgi:5'(3')-deoxyribonucleotidase